MEGPTPSLGMGALPDPEMKINNSGHRAGECVDSNKLYRILSCRQAEEGVQHRKRALFNPAGQATSLIRDPASLPLPSGQYVAAVSIERERGCTRTLHQLCAHEVSPRGSVPNPVTAPTTASRWIILPFHPAHGGCLYWEQKLIHNARGDVL